MFQITIAIDVTNINSIFIKNTLCGKWVGTQRRETYFDCESLDVSVENSLNTTWRFYFGQLSLITGGRHKPCDG